MRLFLASYANVDYYDEIKRDFSPYFDAKWVEPRNLHLTWLFLGEHPSYEEISSRLQPLKMIPKNPLSIQGFGTFGEPEPKVFFLKTSTVISSIFHRKIADLLGMEPEYEFKPHITLARIKKFNSDGFKRPKRPWMSEPLGMVEAPIYLIESRLTQNGPIYIPLEEF